MSLAPPISEDLLPNECPKCRKILVSLIFGEVYCTNCGYYRNKGTHDPDD